MYILLKDLLKNAEGNFLYLTLDNSVCVFSSKDEAIMKYGDKEVINIDTCVNNFGASLVVKVKTHNDVELERKMTKRIESQVELLEGWRSVTSDVMFKLLVNNYIEGFTDALYILGLDYSNLLKDVEKIKKGDIIEK
ncbi:hypothetical protein [Enterococcus phage TJE4]|uniref:Uncharacterized protein n=1 Tax=Enterococcus phage 9183 TaxID=2763102 RepID=A0A7L7SU45_9CAUD|nr:hypothetical protein KNV65_gp071 [Enterococcus phage 9183]QOC57564.1 hypothetical protein phi9183_ORF071 [Enterococcus phage 9183]UVD42895.1 hypothetical protein [Enterococcus phage TJE4]